MQHLHPTVRLDACKRFKRWVGDLPMTFAVPVPVPVPKEDEGEQPAHPLDDASPRAARTHRQNSDRAR